MTFVRGGEYVRGRDNSISFWR